MIFTGITIAVKSGSSAYNVKVVVDADGRHEALEIANDYLQTLNRNARGKMRGMFNKRQPHYKLFDGADQFTCSESHPNIEVFDKIWK